MTEVRNTKQLYKEISAIVLSNHFMNVGNDIIKAIKDYPNVDINDIAWAFSQSFHNMIWDFTTMEEKGRR